MCVCIDQFSRRPNHEVHVELKVQVILCSSGPVPPTPPHPTQSKSSWSCSNGSRSPRGASRRTLRRFSWTQVGLQSGSKLSLEWLK